MSDAVQEQPWVRTVVTTAGDRERESKSRLYNAVEGIGMYLFVLVVLWPFCFYFGKIHNSELIQKVANYPLVLGAMFLLFVSPFLHKDTAESWGVGNPRRLWKLLKGASGLKRAVILGAMLTLMVVLNVANVMRWPDVAKFIGFRDSPVMDYADPSKHPLGLLLVVPFGLIVSSFLVTCAIRYDNFGSAFKTALKISLPLMVGSFVAAYAALGTKAFRNFDGIEYALGVFGYVFWGAVQQLLFSSYFGTRMRKAFGPSANPDNVVPAAKRLATALTIGGAIAACVTIAGYATAVGVYGIEKAPPAMIVWMLGAALPFATAWGYFFTLDKKRMLVATLCGSFFGLIHIDSYGLVAVTFLLGVMLVYVFMEDRNRNLVALGFVHGLLGSTFNWLFSKNAEGAMHVSYSVGPWNIKGEAITMNVLVFPMLCIAAYCALLAWCTANIREEDDAEGTPDLTDPAFATDTAE